jgi:hypothetical protein
MLISNSYHCSGRFWHATDTVMERVGNYMTKRIPEIVSVQLDLYQSSIVDDNRLNSKKAIYII